MLNVRFAHSTWTGITIPFLISFLNLFNGCASNEKKQIAKFHFPLKNADLNNQWIRFVNRRDWLATVLFELHFEEKYFRRGEKCTLQ